MGWMRRSENVEGKKANDNELSCERKENIFSIYSWKLSTEEKVLAEVLFA